MMPRCGPGRLGLCVSAGMRTALTGSAFALLAASALAAPPRSVEGVVSKVTDGDSLWLTPPGQPAIEVRLRDIDAPEICQPWGAEARQALVELALNQPASLTTSGRDVHGRMLGVVKVGAVDLGRRMVEEGHAWSARTRWDLGPLVKQERMARALARGLHGGGGALVPREFRQRHGPCQAGASDGAASATVPAQTPR